MAGPSPLARLSGSPSTCAIGTPVAVVEVRLIAGVSCVEGASGIFLRFVAMAASEKANSALSTIISRIRRR
jgi:hypothetical protein